MFIQGFGGGAPVEDLAGPVVDGGSNGRELLSGPSREVGAFGEVLAQKAVGVQAYVINHLAGIDYPRWRANPT